MPVFGYRVFVVEVYRQQGQTPLDFSECGDEHYQNVAAGLLRTMNGETLVWPPVAGLQTDPEDEDDTSASGGTSEDSGDEGRSRFAGRKGLAVDVIAEDEHTIYGEVLVGTFGDHETALPAPKLVEEEVEADTTDDDGPQPPVDLTDTAPARRYRFVLNTPAKGKTGVLLVEDIGRSCPADLLVRWLNKRGKAQAAAELAALGGGNAVKRKDRPTWWRLKHTPAVDDNHFRAMVAKGQLERVELLKHGPDAAGNRTVEIFRMSAPQPEALGKVDDLIELLKKWVDDKRERQATVLAATPGENGKRRRLTRAQRELEKHEARRTRTDTDASAAADMAAILGDNIAQIGFDDGWMVIKDGDRDRRVSPTRLSELFIYELNRSRRPSRLEFYEAGSYTAVQLQTALKLTVEWPKVIAFE